MQYLLSETINQSGLQIRDFLYRSVLIEKPISDPSEFACSNIEALLAGNPGSHANRSGIIPEFGQYKLYLLERHQVDARFKDFLD